jgi:hypothetical protein
MFVFQVFWVNPDWFIWPTLRPPNLYIVAFGHKAIEGPAGFIS